MKSVAAALLLLMTPAAAQTACNLKTLSACRNINQLMWAPGTVPAIRDFLKGLPGNYLYPASHRKSSAASDAIAVLGGPPGDTKPLPGGLSFFPSCQAHNCTEQGAMVVNAAGRIEAIGILNHHCGKACGPPVLDLFLRTDVARTVAGDAIRNWADDAAAGEYTSGEPPHHLAGITIKDISGP